MTYVFQDEPTEEDKLQAKGRVVRLRDLPPEEQERLRAAPLYLIAEGTVDDRIAEVLRRKQKAISEVSRPEDQP